MVKKIIILVLVFFVADFGVYKLLKSGIIKYYGLEKKARILCVGHSQTVLGIDAEKLEESLGVPVAKYAIAGANVLDRFWMIKHYLNMNPNVRTVIYGVDARMFDSEGLSSASYTLFLPFINNHVMEQYLRKQATPEEFYTCKFIKTARFRDQTLNIALRGLLNHIENKKVSRVRIEDKESYLERERKHKVRINTKSVECFNKTMRYLSSLGKTVLLVNIPVIDLLNEIDIANQKKAIKIFQAAAKRYKGVYFLDYNQDYEHDHQLFFDLRHLNEQGNLKVTNRLIQDLRRIEAVSGSIGVEHGNSQM